MQRQHKSISLTASSSEHWLNFRWELNLKQQMTKIISSSLWRESFDLDSTRVAFTSEPPIMQWLRITRWLVYNILISIIPEYHLLKYKYTLIGFSTQYKSSCCTYKYNIEWGKDFSIVIVVHSGVFVISFAALICIK